MAKCARTLVIRGCQALAPHSSGDITSQISREFAGEHDVTLKQLGMVKVRYDELCPMTLAMVVACEDKKQRRYKY